MASHQPTLLQKESLLLPRREVEVAPQPTAHQAAEPPVDRLHILVQAHKAVVLHAWQTSRAFARILVLEPRMPNGPGGYFSSKVAGA